MRPAAVSLSIMFFAVALTVPQTTFGHSGDAIVSKWTDVPPAIDGSLSQGEWAGLVRVATTTYPGELDASADFAAANDQENMYLMFKVNLPEGYTANSQNWRMDSLYLDVDHDGAFNEGKDIVIREADWGGKFGPVDKSPYYGTYSTNAAGYDRARILERAVSWTGNGWIYELKLPFTLDDGYNWGGPDSTVGMALNFVAWVGERYDEFSGNTVLVNHQQLVLPPESSTHFTGTLSKHQLTFLTPYPPLFGDVMLADIPATFPQIPETEDVQESISTFPDNTGLYIGAGVAAAGAAIAGAIVATRRRRPKNPRA